MTIEYCFVLDSNGKQLSPTKANKAWYLIRKNRATLKVKYPMVIQLHKNIGDNELNYAESFYSITKGRNIRFDYAQHVMQGKTYLRNELSKIAKLELTLGTKTANIRIDHNIEKTHANDALVIAGITHNNTDICNFKIRPMRRKSKANINSINGFKHRDLVKYTKRNGEGYIGWITALYLEKNQCNITTLDGKILKRYGVKNLKLLWRFNNLYFLNVNV